MFKFGFRGKKIRMNNTSSTLKYFLHAVFTHEESLSSKQIKPSSKLSPAYLQIFVPSKITIVITFHLKSILDGFWSNSGKLQVSIRSSTDIKNTSKWLLFTKWILLFRSLRLPLISFWQHYCICRCKQVLQAKVQIVFTWQCRKKQHTRHHLLRDIFRVTYWNASHLRVLVFRIPKDDSIGISGSKQ